MVGFCWYTIIDRKMVNYWSWCRVLFFKCLSQENKVAVYCLRNRRYCFVIWSLLLENLEIVSLLLRVKWSSFGIAWMIIWKVSKLYCKCVGNIHFLNSWAIPNPRFVRISWYCFVPCTFWRTFLFCKTKEKLILFHYLKVLVYGIVRSSMNWFPIESNYIKGIYLLHIIRS